MIDVSRDEIVKNIPEIIGTVEKPSK